MALTKAEINKEICNRLETLYKESMAFELFVEDQTRNAWRQFCYNSWDIELDEKFDFCLCNGASRGVIVYNDFDWVVKFCFREEVERKSYDFNEAEVQIYTDAVTKGLQDFFAEIWCGGDFHGLTFYIMEKANTDPSEVDADFYSGVFEAYPCFYEYESTDEGEMNDDDVAGIANFFGNYGAHERVVELLNFCSYQYVCDIHEKNVGFIGERPVFIDYAGY